MEQQNQQPVQEKTENKPPVKTNTSTGSVQGWKFLAIVVVFAFLTIGGILLFASLNKSSGINPIASAQCNQLAQEIDILVKQANYCEADEDCVVQKGLLPGSPPPCSCTYAVNKDYTDSSALEDASRRWYSECGEGIMCEPCAPPPQFAKCEQNQCVGVWNQDNSAIDTSAWQTYRNDEFGFEVKYPPSLGEFADYNKVFVAHAKTYEFESIIWTVAIKIITGESSLKDYLEEFNNRRTAPHIEFESTAILKTRETKVGPYQAVQYETSLPYGPSYQIETYLDLTPDMIVALTVGRLRNHIDESLYQLNNQILSTFRFVGVGVDK